MVISPLINSIYLLPFQKIAGDPVAAIFFFPKVYPWLKPLEKEIFGKVYFIWDENV